MDESLKSIFANVNEWLKFAEAKLTGLIALNVALLIGVVQSHQAFNGKIEGFDGLLIFLFCISIFICIYSFLPILNRFVSLVKKMDQREFAQKKALINSIFYGEIARLTTDQYIDVLMSKNPAINIQQNSIDSDLINQIVVNSTIALSKYRLFWGAATFTLMGVALGAILVLVRMS